MMPLRTIVLPALLAGLLLVTGCLWVEKAEFQFSVKPGGSGTGTLRFHNIGYLMELDFLEEFVEPDTLEAAMDQLLMEYLEGDALDDAFTGLTITGRRLFQRDSMLMGEIAFTFESMDGANFHRYRNERGEFYSYLLPPLFSVYSTDLVTSNADFTAEAEGEPFLVWDAETPEFSFGVVTERDTTEGGAPVSLLAEWQRRGADSSWHEE